MAAVPAKAPAKAPTKKSTPKGESVSGKTVVDAKTKEAEKKATDQKKTAEKVQKGQERTARNRQASSEAASRKGKREVAQKRRQQGKALDYAMKNVPFTAGKGRTLFYTAFFASVAVISWQEIKVFKRMPLPSRFISAGVAYSLLAIAEPIISEDLSGWLAWGLFMGLVYAQHGATSDMAPAIPSVANTNVPKGVQAIELTLQPSSDSGNTKQGGNTPPSTGGGTPAKKLAGGPTQT